MKYALVIIEVDGDMLSSAQSLANFADMLEHTGTKSPQIERLNIGSYLAPLDHGLTALSRIVSEASRHKYRTRTLFFDQSPSFILSSPKPEH